ncbi:MAG: sigW 4 [Verrucomicrobiales bacterium]|jgi:RNA polymerase sigma-70 factor (ECF subfamily)|nr:sigW 4 [Verrucomicrobiales bacterium]MDB6129776.1 sigW 4 [Verrucomicrobiales bacterium]
MLLLYGRALGFSHSESEDLLQETFIKLLAMKVSPENPGHYAVRTFRNRALNYKRSIWRRLTRELESKLWFESSGDDHGQETQAMLMLAGLPAEQREVIVLKFWHELTFEEIGQLLEVSANTAAGRYRYGLNKLKAKFKDPSQNEDESTETAGTANDKLEAKKPFPWLAREAFSKAS